MTKTIAVTDDLYERLASLARPFLDREPADVIRRLVDKEAGQGETEVPKLATSHPAAGLIGRAPRERGAVVEINGAEIRADSVPDLCAQVMDYMFNHKHWDKVLRLAPYKTSAQRYLFSKIDKHPNGNDFFVPIKCHGLYVETHKNYQTAITQLERFTSKCGVSLAYKGT